MSYLQKFKFKDNHEDPSDWYYACLVFGIVLGLIIFSLGGW